MKLNALDHVNIITDDLGRIAVDGAVRVAFDPVTEDITLPKFTLA